MGQWLALSLIFLNLCLLAVYMAYLHDFAIQYVVHYAICYIVDNFWRKIIFSIFHIVSIIIPYCLKHTVYTLYYYYLLSIREANFHLLELTHALCKYEKM